MNEVKTFMEEYFPLTSMAIEKAMALNDRPGGDYYVEKYTIEIDDNSDMYEEGFPGVFQKFEHIMKMAKQGGVQFGRESIRESSYGQIIEDEFRSRVIRESSYGQIIEDEFRSRVMGSDETDSGSVSVRSALTIEDYGEVPNLVIFVFIYNRNFVKEPYHRDIAKNLDIKFSMQLISDIERMYELYVARKFTINDEKYISAFTNTAVEYMIQHNQIGTTGLLGNIVAHAVLELHPEFIYPIYRLSNRVRFVFVDKKTTDLKALTDAFNENIESIPNDDDDTIIKFLLDDSNMCIGRYVYDDCDTHCSEETQICLISCTGTSNEEVGKISLMLKILDEYGFFEKPGITISTMLKTGKGEDNCSLRLIDDPENLEALLNNK